MGSEQYKAGLDEHNGLAEARPNNKRQWDCVQERNTICNNETPSTEKGNSEDAFVFGEIEQKKKKRKDGSEVLIKHGLSSRISVNGWTLGICSNICIEN
jgi:hypothetical protein